MKKHLNWQVGYDFRAKIVYTAHIVRRVLMTVIDPTTVDDKVRQRGYTYRRQDQIRSDRRRFVCFM